MTFKTLGILGGGQLGRMSAQAAQKLGIQTVIFTPEEDSPAAQVADTTIIAPYDDQDALKKFAAQVDVISYEFENIPLDTVRFVKGLKPVYPEENLLEIAQDRRNEKQFLNDAGIQTARWREITDVKALQSTFTDWGVEKLILKTARFGYDGKGQIKVAATDDLAAALNTLAPHPVIAEDIVDFACEVSVIIARDKTGGTQTYGPILNEHKNHILHKSICPAPLDPALAERAVAATIRLAEAVNLRGVLALEMFVTKDNRILANEIAPRTHNSGHWTIDACAVSQFENHVRTVCGLQAAPPDQHSAAEMINLIGDDVNDIAQYEAQENACIHLYGKHDIKPGRKMGHVTIITPLTNLNTFSPVIPSEVEGSEKA